MCQPDKHDTIDGKKSLHLKEIQSDWHQQGRDKGYKNKPEPVENYVIEGNDPWVIKNKRTGDIEHDFNRKQDAEEYLKDIQKGLILPWRKNNDGVPDAPFKKTWHELALKRAIREAAENGYERLSWTPGEAQAARYDLSKQVEAIRYKKNEDGTYQLSAEDKSGRGHILGEKLNQNQLADNVGKELAEKIIKGEGKEENLGGSGSSQKNIWNRFDNVDLKIGGEGMKGFYDNIVPKSIEKIAKEFGVKIQKGKIKTNKTGYEYNGPELSLNDMQNRTGKFTHKEYNILGDIIIAMSEGMSFKDAMSKYGNKEIAKRFGGELKPIVKGEPVFYIDIPSAMRQSIMGKGQPLFSGTPTLTPIDYQPEFEEETK